MIRMSVLSLLLAAVVQWTQQSVTIGQQHYYLGMFNTTFANHYKETLTTVNTASSGSLITKIFTIIHTSVITHISTDTTDTRMCQKLTWSSLGWLIQRVSQRRQKQLMSTIQQSQNTGVLYNSSLYALLQSTWSKYGNITQMSYSSFCLEKNL